MADPSTPLPNRIAAVLPYALPVLGGTVGVFYVNSTAHGNPLFGVVFGALIGWGLARILAKPLDAMADRQRSER